MAEEKPPAVIIIGAGLAGLSAALELKKKAIPFIVLEAAAQPGGRCRSETLPDKTVADLGAHWLHMHENDPLFDLVKHYKLRYKADPYKNVTVYNPQGEEIDPNLFKNLLGKIPADINPRTSLYSAIDDPHATPALTFIAQLWCGVKSAHELSAKQFASDKNTPGGIILTDGLGALTRKMAQEVGYEHIRFESPVAQVATQKDRAVIEMKNGETLNAKHVIYTGSAATLHKSVKGEGNIRFYPPLNAKSKALIHSRVMGRLTKMIFQLDSSAIKPDLRDSHVYMLDNEQPLFCHIGPSYGEGEIKKPVLTVLFGGPNAEKAEKMDAATIRSFLQTKLRKTKLSDIAQSIESDPVITKWNDDPHVGGCYASLRPNARMPEGPLSQGRLTIAGEAFPPKGFFTGYASSAYLSGIEAAKTVEQELQAATRIFSTEEAKSLSPKEFRAMLEGRTRTRYKMIVDPDNGKLYRLVFKGDGESHYAEMAPNSVTVYHYALSEKAKENYRAAPAALADSYSIRSFHIQMDSKKSPTEHQLSRRQFFELEKAVSISSGWWPLEGLSWGVEENLKRTKVDVLFDEKKMPVGFIAVEDCGRDKQNPIKSIAMVGLIPGYQKRGLGRRLVEGAIHKLLKESPDTRITLCTSDLDKKPNGDSAKVLYEKMGFEYESEEWRDYARLIAHHKNRLEELDLYNAYVPQNYYDDSSGKRLPRFRQDEIERRLKLAFNGEEKEIRS